jgi:hypothetical protein
MMSEKTVRRMEKALNVNLKAMHGLYSVLVRESS